MLAFSPACLRRTDFEVHRNWLAVSALPIEAWYRESTSQWTLDYPPLFAWFQRGLAAIAKHVDPAMLELSEAPVETPKTIVFLRLSVSLVGDSVLLLAVWLAMRTAAAAAAAAAAGTSGGADNAVGAAFVLLSPALMLVDHIHFQYNGMLIGVLLVAIHCAQVNKPVAAALAFSATLYLKHLFVYAVPAFTIYLFVRYCATRGGVWMFFKLGSAVLGVSALSLGPMIATDQIVPMMERLFPFERGLLHASWAPNAWALYAAVDKGLSFCLYAAGERQRASLAGGLVAVQSFQVLPNVRPWHCLGLAGVAMLPALVACVRSPAVSFHRLVGYALLCGFMFGYHVHEKAIIPPMMILMFAEFYRARVDWSARSKAVFLSVVAAAVQFPLLFTLAEHPIKHLMTLGYALVAVPVWLREHPRVQGRAVSVLSVRSLWMGIRRGLAWWQVGALGGGVCVEAYVGSGVHRLVWGGRLPFLPLMMQSVFYAVVLVVVWASEAAYFARLCLSRGGKKRV